MSGKARLRIKPAGARFADAVLADLLAIRRMSEGRMVFRKLRDLGALVTIERPDPSSEPPNAWTQALGPEGQHAGEIRIFYDPACWPHPVDPAGLGGAEILFGRLKDAVIMAAEM